jgi:hypothetical protein
MNMFSGIIMAVRDHPIAPVQVDFDLGDGVITQWMPVDIASWACVEFEALEAGSVECVVLEFQDEQYPYRVGQIFPSGSVQLPANKSKLARVGDPVATTGQVTALTLGLPAMVSMRGRIT